MKFIRLDENTVRCVLSKADLDDHGVAMSDFVEHNQSAKELIDFLLNKIIQELNYVKKGEMISINVMALPEDSIALTFSDASNELRAMIKHMVEIFKSLNLDKEPMDNNEKRIKDAMIDEELQKISLRLAGGVPTVTDFDYFAFKFSSLKDAISYSKTLNIKDNRMVASTNLYRCSGEKEDYYMTMYRGSMEQAYFNYMGLSALEFAVLESANEITQFVIDEHHSLIIAEDAIETLRKL